MSHSSPGAEADGKLDLVPMIDCVMLLLLFFILTSNFKTEDLRISALLPTSGPGPTKAPVVAPPTTVRIAVMPGEGRTARVRIGGGPEILIDASALTLPGGPVVEGALDTLHAALAERLGAYEQPGGRQDQPPVEIHCAKSLPWSCALVVYDGVRAYEKARTPPSVTEIPIDAQRNVAFAAPVVLHSRGDNPFDEMERLEHLR